MVDYFKNHGMVSHLKPEKSCIILRNGISMVSGLRVFKIKIPNWIGSEFLEAIIREEKVGFHIRLYGNLRKWRYGKKSAILDLNYTDYCLSIKLIAKRLGVAENEIRNFEFSSLELGGNIKLPRNYEVFIPSLLAYPELNIDRWKEETVYFFGTKYRLIFYDKLKEMRDRRIISRKVANKLIKQFFILRFEIKIDSKSGYRKKEEVRTFGTIKENWLSLSDDWRESFQKAKIVDLFSDSKKMYPNSLTKKEMKEYGNFLLINNIGIDRGLYYFQYFMKNRKSEAVTYIQCLFKNYKTGENWNFYENILTEVYHKSETMKVGCRALNYNKGKTTTKTV